MFARSARNASTSTCEGAAWTSTRSCLEAESDGARHGEESDHGADHRVDPCPLGGHHQETARQHAEGSKHVGDHFEVGATQVEALVGAGPQQPEGRKIDDETNVGHHEQRDRWHLDRIGEAVDGLPQHVDPHAGQEDGVGQCGEDFESVQAEGVATRTLVTIGR
ncbi:hypothetical protein GCM10027597_19040 [Saccharopolyspora tripterygii]